MLDLSGLTIIRVTPPNPSAPAGSRGFVTDSVSASGYMFVACTSLVGGSGTPYDDANPNDVTYAHIDGGATNPGYFAP